MKLSLILLIFFTILASSYSTKLYAQQDKPFSIQLNTGYTYMVGKKLSVATGKLGLGSLTSGQIPIGIEVRYKFINHLLWNPQYKNRMDRWSNYFTDRLYLNFGYTAFVGIPYTYIQQGANWKDTYRLNLNTHTLRIGAMYDFTNNFENLLGLIFNTSVDFKRVRTYAGIDFLVLLQKTNNQYTRTLQDANQSSGSIKSNLFANFGIMPKVEVEYYLPPQAFGKGRFSQWWYNHNFYINGAVQYTMIIPSKIKGFPLPEEPSQQSLHQSLNFNIGIGFRF